MGLYILMSLASQNTYDLYVFYNLLYQNKHLEEFYYKMERQEAQALANNPEEVDLSAFDETLSEMYRRQLREHEAAYYEAMLGQEQSQPMGEVPGLNFTFNAADDAQPHQVEEVQDDPAEEMKASELEEEKSQEEREGGDEEDLGEEQPVDLSNVNMDLMSWLATKISADVPRVNEHIVWRMALFVRHQTPYINSTESTFFTWDDLAKIFDRKSGATFRQEVDRRRKRHKSHSEEEFNVFEVEADEFRPRSKEYPDEVHALAVSKETLSSQIGLTLPERAAKLTQQTGVHVTTARLSGWYKLAGIKLKSVKLERCVDNGNVSLQNKRRKEHRELSWRYEAALQQGIRVLYLDETTFQKRDLLLLKQFAGPNERMTVIDKARGTENIQVLAVMDRSRVVWWSIKNKDQKYDTDYYISQLRVLYAYLGKPDKVALFTDNLGQHLHAKTLKVLYDELKWLPIQNIAYSPEHMPIETWFSHLKATYRKELIRMSRDMPDELPARDRPTRLAIVKQAIIDCQDFPLDKVTLRCERIMQETLGVNFRNDSHRQTSKRYLEILQKAKLIDLGR